MLDQIAPDVYTWTELDGPPGRRNGWHSYTIRVAETGILALFDPLKASSDEIYALGGAWTANQRALDMLLAPAQRGSVSNSLEMLNPHSRIGANLPRGQG